MTIEKKLIHFYTLKVFHGKQPNILAQNLPPPILDYHELPDAPNYNGKHSNFNTSRL